MKKRNLGAALAVALLVASGMSWAAASAMDAPSPNEAGCIEMNGSGDQAGHGTAPQGLQRLGDELARLADRNHAQVSGVAYCSDRSGVAIFVAKPSAEVLSSIDAIQRRYPRLSVVVREVAAGLTAQLDASARITKQFRDFISGVGPDPYTGGILISLLPSAAPLSKGLRDQMVAVATRGGRVAMPISTEVTPRLVDDMGDGSR
ncbi:MAG: hypothetical protein ACTHJM_12000 [Marmoricola sp.]